MIFRDNEWISDADAAQIIAVRVKQPEVEHRVRVREFERWLESAGKSPAEMALKQRLLQHLRK